MAIEDTLQNTTKQVHIKTIHSGKYNGYGIGLSTKPVANCHKCDIKGCIQSYYKFNGNVFGGDSSKKNTREIPKYVINKPVVMDIKYLITENE